MGDQSNEEQSYYEPDEDLVKAIKEAEKSKRTGKSTVIQQAPCPQVNMSKIVFVMVGLPARGKSYVAKIVTKYLNWLSINCQLFNVGEYRRSLLGAGQHADFFDSSRSENLQARKKLSELALIDTIKYLKNEGGQVALFDATNTTRDRREYIVQTLLGDHSLGMTKSKIVFLEIICNDPKILETNVRAIKVKSSDYINWDPEEAYKDFSMRIKQYEDVYQPLDELFDESLSYIKSIDVGKRIVLNRISGYIPSRITSLIMNLHIVPKKIFLCRTGETEFIKQGRFGGDQALNTVGMQFAKSLADFFAKNQEPDMVVWTSTMLRGLQTCTFMENYPIVQFKALDEISFGVHDGKTSIEIAQLVPHDMERRKQDKYRYRFPRGESYEDVCNRLDPLIIELERQQSPVLIVSHNAVIRILYAYLKGIKPENCTDIPIPIHSVIELHPGAYVNPETVHQL